MIQDADGPPGYCNCDIFLVFPYDFAAEFAT
jgi:hypothetical protein